MIRALGSGLGIGVKSAPVKLIARRSRPSYSLLGIRSPPLLAIGQRRGERGEVYSPRTKRATTFTPKWCEPTHSSVRSVWLFSAQFHARDTLVAERLDYFGAALMLYLTLYLTLWRNFPTYKNTLQLAVLVAYW